MNRKRSVLHHGKIDQFLVYAESKGHEQAPIKGCFEVFRLVDKKGNILIASKRDKSDHVTTTGRLTKLVDEWLNSNT